MGKAAYDYSRFRLHISASQMETFLSCPRKWWFQSVLRFKTGPNKNQESLDFGEVLHAVVERWLMSDDTGRGVELYPDGWANILKGPDAEILKLLVNSAIEQGIITRQPGRRLEAPIGTQQKDGRYAPLPVIPGVGMIGYRDVACPGRVEDHKTSGTDSYLKTQTGLLSDTQLMIYGYTDVQEHGSSEVLLRHNQFVRDRKAPKVTSVEALATKEQVETFWKEVVVPCAERMLKLKFAYKPASEWPSIEGPQKQGVCKQYGGCAFQLVCARQETPEQFKERIQLQLDQPPPPKATPEEEELVAGIFNRLKDMQVPAKAALPQTPAAQAAAPAQAPAPKPPAEKVTMQPIPSQASAPATSPAREQGAPPWANETCRACGGKGFNSKGNPCAGCDRFAEANGGTSSKAFEIYQEGGKTKWSPFTSEGVAAVVEQATRELGEAVADAIGKGLEEAAARAQEVVDAGEVDVAPAVETGKSGRTVTSDAVRARAAAKVAEQAAIAQGTNTPPGGRAKAQDEPAVPEEKTAPTEAYDTITEPVTLEASAKATALNSAPGEDKAKKGFTMIYGAARRCKAAMLDLNLIHARYGAELATRLDAPSFYSIDAFKRRDMMAAAAAEIASTIPASAIVLVRADCLDMKSFANAIEPFASSVFTGVS